MKKQIILTFDLEEWFHLCLDDHPNTWDDYENRFEENIDFILGILDDHGSRATFLVLGWIAKKYPKIIRKIYEQGHDVGSHSNNHELIYQQSKSEFESDLIDSINILEDIIDNQVSIYRAPAFSINNDNKWALEIIAKNNIQYDLSLFQGNHSLGGIRCDSIDEPFFINTDFGRLLEYPMSVTSFLGVTFASCGGGYFRLLPFSIIKSLIKNNDYNMTYFHPRDFDDNQPRISMPLMRYFKTYVGLSSSKLKFEKILSTFDSISLTQDLKRRDLASSQIIDLERLGK